MLLNAAARSGCHDMCTPHERLELPALAHVQGALRDPGARHVLVPRTATSVERQGGTVQPDAARGVGLRPPLRSNSARLGVPGRWMEFFNSVHPHTALDGHLPASRL